MLAGTLGTASAQPGKNRVFVDAACEDGTSLHFYLNGEGNVGHVEGSNERVVVKSYTVHYADANTGEPLGTQTVDNGKKKGLQDRLVRCVGQTTLQHVDLGDVIATFDFRAFTT